VLVVVVGVLGVPVPVVQVVEVATMLHGLVATSLTVDVVAVLVLAVLGLGLLGPAVLGRGCHGALLL
jgi:hypothetical protein